MKIWRYMDLAKFISIMSNKSLYFTSFSKFDDPYECYLPEVYNKPINTLIENNSQKIYEKAKTIIKKFENEYPEKYLDAMKNISSIYESSLLSYKNSVRELRDKFGVSCWHINEYENESLWKIYTNQGQGIAIETTVEKLKQSLQFHRKITFDKVRYEDFNTTIFEKNHKNYLGYIKRKAFEYENEFRAVVLLDENYFEKGCYIKVDLDILIEKIHISPAMPKYFLESIKYLCQGELSFLQDRIAQSSLYSKYTN
mgnify:FL=1